MLLMADCKMCSLEMRATIVEANHLYYMPLAQNHIASRQWAKWIDDAVAGTLPALTAIFRDEELLGYGYEFTRIQSYGVQTWTERVQIIRSLARVPSAEETIDRHVQRASEAIFNLTPLPKQGCKQIKDENELKKSINLIMRRYSMEDVMTVTWKRDDTYKNGQDFRFIITQVEVNDEKLRNLKNHTGWRVFITNASHERLPLDEGVLLYRKGAGQGIERMNGMFKGSPLGISPLFVRNDDQIIGLAYLLTLALRVMSYFETMVRDALAKTNDKLPEYTPDGIESANPTAKTMLERIAKQGVTLTEVKMNNGQREYHLTKLPNILMKILEISKLTPTIYECLIE
jgi:transposase